MSALRLKFNTDNVDYSDACSLGGGYFIFSSTKKGGKDGYDLYLAHEDSDKVILLDRFHPDINSSQEDLAADYTDKREYALSVNNKTRHPFPPRWRERMPNS